MKNKSKKSQIKDHGSDDEGESQPTDKKGRVLSKFEQEVADLESAPVIPDSEISPAAFIFTPTEEE